jgi:RimJ/RimL family protein N-acetyltransferase
VGTIAIYDAQGRHRAEWGRWVAEPGGLFGVRAILLLYRMAFEIMDFESLYVRTVADNCRGVKFHDNCGLRRIEIQSNAVCLRGRHFDLVVHEITKPEWPRVKDWLEMRIGSRQGQQAA